MANICMYHFPTVVNNYNEYIVGLYDNLDKLIIEHYRDNSKFPDTIQNIPYVNQYTEQFWNYKNPKYMHNILSQFYHDNYRYHCSALSALS